MDCTMQEEEKLMQQLKQLAKEKPNSCSSSLVRNKKLESLRKFLFDKTKFLDQHFQEASVELKICTRIWYLVNGHEEILKCQNPKCQKPLVKNISAKGAYIQKYCCSKCAASDPLVQERKEISCLKSLGVRHPAQNSGVITKMENSCLRKFGFKNASQAESIKEKKVKTTYKNFGTKSYFESEEFRQKNLKLYGVEFLSQRSDVRAKIYKTHKRNHSFKTSKLEQEAFWMLKFIFPKLQTQFKSDAYPFHTDFYDPDQPNVRFEFQGSWTHGGHPFDPMSEEDQKQLRIMQEKGTKYYQNAIDTWTRRDPMKREVAKKNGIMLIEFWNIEEVRRYVIDFPSKVNSHDVKEDCHGNREQQEE